MKTGVEVEGRFKGLKTLFIEYDEFRKLDSDYINSVADNHKCTQIQIHSSSKQAIDALDPKFEHLAHCGKVITIDAHYLIGEVPDYLNVILVLEKADFPDFWKLKPTDQIKFNSNRNVKIIPLENMYTAKPEDFDADIQI